MEWVRLVIGNVQAQLPEFPSPRSVLQPGVYFANTADNGDPLSVDTSIHTLDKLTVGRRLGAAVLATYYNQTEVMVSWRQLLLLAL